MFELLLTLHILSAIWLMTNLIGAAYWKKRADQSGNREQVASTAQALVRADLIFTAPGIVGLLATGIWMVGLTSWRRFEEPWLGASFVLTVLIGILWLAILMPQQRRLAQLALQRLEGSSQEGASQDEAYRRASKIWNITGGVMTLIPIVVLFLMVFKP